MKICKLEYRHLSAINKWRKKHRQAAIAWHEMPSIAYIVPGVAVGALRACEGGVGIFDSLITNPHVSSETRHKALESIYNAILSTTGFNRILGFSTDVSALERAKAHGFKQLQYTVLSYSKE